MSTIALVLGGGGARGAFEVGVLRYIARALPESIRKRVRYDIIVGTSSGAINGAFMAQGADDPRAAAEELWERWCALTVGGIYKVQTTRLLRAGAVWLRGANQSKDVALLDTTPLNRMLRQDIEWGRIGRNLAAGHLQALCVTTTELASSRSIMFVQGAAEDSRLWGSSNPYIRPVAATIKADHILASAAIPLLFPPVQIGDRWYADGGLHQLTPLRPVLRMGADKVLVISLRMPLTLESAEARAESLGGGAPNWAQLIGKTMNSVLLDHASQEVARLQRINRMLAWGTERFGSDFPQELGNFMEPERGAPYKHIDSLLIAPQQDLGRLAHDYFQSGKLDKSTEALTKRVVNVLGRMDKTGENDVLSYLLFDGGFMRVLSDEGEKAAAAHHDELCAFFE